MEFIKIDEKDYPVCVDFSILKLISKKFGVKLSEIQAILEDAEKLDYIFYHSLKRGHEKANEKFDLTESQTTDLLCYPSAVGDLLIVIGKGLSAAFTPSKKSKM